VEIEMKTEIMTITPDLAQKFLASNNENRPIKKWWVTALSGAMRRGEWKLSHQGIAIGQDGRLLDGQHRLLAVVSCGIPVLMSVTTGVDCDSFISMDVGVKRTVSDSTGLDSGVASVSRAIAMYCYGGTITTAQAYKIAKCGVEEEALSLLATCGTAARVFSSTGFRAAAITLCLDGHNREYIHSQYRALVLQNYSDMSPSVMAASKAATLGTIRTSDPFGVFCYGLKCFDDKNIGMHKLQMTTQFRDYAREYLRRVILTRTGEL
jgi:hypothetical protein